jgi:hypothetical protein
MITECEGEGSKGKVKDRFKHYSLVRWPHGCGE